MGNLDQWLGPVLTGGLTLGGVWIVLRLIVGFQRDFSDAYAARLQQQDQKIAELEGRLNECEQKRLAMLARLDRAEPERQRDTGD